MRDRSYRRAQRRRAMDKRRSLIRSLCWYGMDSAEVDSLMYRSVKVGVPKWEVMPSYHAPVFRDVMEERDPDCDWYGCTRRSEGTSDLCMIHHLRRLGL